MSLMFLPHFDVFWDLLLNRRTATWILKEQKQMLSDSIYPSVLQLVIAKNQSNARIL